MNEEEVIQRGEESMALLAAFRGRVELQKARVKDKLLSHYGMTSLDNRLEVIYGLVGELKALEDLIGALESDRRRGLATSQEVRGKNV